VRLEWDDKKRNKALAERGLDFADVARVDWDTAFTVEDTRADYAEARFVTMAPINNPVRFRLVSARRGSPRDQPSQSERERKKQI
jgi:uncharacterized DUF497 family protein